jgi:hypothetical protein
MAKLKPETDHARCQANITPTEGIKNQRCPERAVTVVIGGDHYLHLPFRLACEAHATPRRGFGRQRWMELDLIPTELSDALLTAYQAQSAEWGKRVEREYRSALKDLLAIERVAGTVESERQRRQAEQLELQS